MSLQPKDLINGGLYRHKETGDIYRYHIGGGFKNESNKLDKWTYGFRGFGDDLYDLFEGIPITPDVLKDWFGFAEMEPLIDNLVNPYFAKNGLLLFYAESDRNAGRNPMPVLPGIGFHWGKQTLAATAKWVYSVHDVQRSYLALTGSELEGGPE